MQNKLTAAQKEAQGFSPQQIQSFLSKIEKTESCWLWKGRRGTSHGRPGYGLFTANDTQIRAHRVSWILHKGPIPDGQFVLHNCPGGDNKACCNPEHLWLGTHQQNMADGWKKGQYIPNIGRDVVNRKLTFEQAEHLRSEYIPGKVGLKTLANKYGISKRAVLFIIQSKTYVKNKSATLLGHSPQNHPCFLRPSANANNGAP